jgi:hypothetical protein
MPVDYRPSDDVMAAAVKACPDVDVAWQTRQCALYYAGRGTLLANHEAVWLAWVERKQHEAAASRAPVQPVLTLVPDGPVEPCPDGEPRGAAFCPLCRVRDRSASGG